MFSDFFTYESDLPAGSGFALYGPAHLVWLAFLLAGGTAVCIMYRRCRQQARHRILLILGWAMVGLIAARTLCLCIIGRMSVYELPLHLCSLAGFLCLIYAWKSWDWLGQVLYTVCLPGAVSALLFLDWNRYPALSFISIESFLFHAAIPVFVICALLSGEIQPSIRRVWKVWVFFAVLVPPVYVLDRKISANYMFVNVPSPGSPLELLAAWMGVPGYLVGYGLLAAAVLLLMDLPWDLCRHLRARKNKSA